MEEGAKVTQLRPDPGWQLFYDEKVFVPRRLARYLADEVPIARGGGEVHTWRNGVYAPGEDELYVRMDELLEEKFTKARAKQVIDILLKVAPVLDDVPPEDRIAVWNGIVEVDTGKLLPPDSEFLTPVRINAVYDPAARCERFERFLDEITDGDAQLRQLLVELAGYLLTSDTSQQKAVLLLGKGGNGKSTYLNVIRGLLGAENVSAVSWKTLGHRFGSVGIYGKLANFDPDVDTNAVANSDLFKTIVDGKEAISGERKFKDRFNFVPYARLVFAANAVPRARDASDGFFRRWIVIPFERRFDNTPDVDKHLVAELSTPAARSGILNTALAGLQSLRERGGFNVEGRAAAALADFERESDPVAGFLAYGCRYGSGLKVERSKVHTAVKAWAAANGYPPQTVPTQHATPQRVREQIERQGLPVRESKVGTWRLVGMTFDDPEE